MLIEINIYVYNIYPFNTPVKRYTFLVYERQNLIYRIVFLLAMNRHGQTAKESASILKQC